MAIGVAMLGIGLSGTLVAVRGPIGPEASERWFGRSALAVAVALIGVPALAGLVPLDSTQLFWDARQWPRLGALYALLAVPFLAGGLATLLAVQAAGDHPGRMYGASFIGAAAGSIAALGALAVTGPARALAFPALLAAAGATGAAAGRRARVQAAASVALAGAALVHPLWDLNLLPYKTLRQVEAFPDARRVAERSSPLGWVVAVRAPAFRHAPGLSLAYRGGVPMQIALAMDGDVIGAVPVNPTDPALDSMLDWLPAALPYALGTPRSVLVLGAGGGSEVWNAAAHGAREVTAVELVPDVIDVTRDLAARRDSVASRPIRWVAADARSFVARARRRWDLITIGPASGPGAVGAGRLALSEDYLHTTEAYARYLELLTARGTVAITQWLTLPPKENVRIVLTAAAALRRVAPEHVADGIIVMRSWGTATTLIRPAGFTSADVARVERWAEERQFDIDWRPGLGAPASRFHGMDEATLFEAAAAAVADPDRAAPFAASQPFAVAPAEDVRPYPHHFLRLRSLRLFLRGGAGNWLPFAEWGLVMLVATLLQGVVLAALLLVGPALVRMRRVRLRTAARLTAYFAAIGLGYMGAEIALIQSLTLLLGHPVYAVATVLTVLLVSSGIGSVRSDRSAPAASARVNGLAGAALLLFAAALLPIVHAVQGAPLAVRGLLALLVLAPPAFAMGMPFPLGLRHLSGSDQPRVAWAWATNGFASVVGAPLAAITALTLGSRWLLVLSGTAYLIAAAASYGGRAGPPRHAPAA